MRENTFLAKMDWGQLRDRAYELLQQCGEDTRRTDLAEYSEEDLQTLITVILEDEPWDVFRIWLKKPKLDWPASVGVGPGRDAHEGLSAYLASSPTDKEGVFYVCKGPGETPRVANPFSGVCLKVEGEQISYCESE